MPSVKLTQKFITDIDCDQIKKPTYYNDTLQHGLTLIVNPGGRKSYHLRLFVAGKQYKLSIASADEISLEAARKLAKQYADQYREGKAPLDKSAARTSKSKTLTEIYNAWLDWSAAHPAEPGAGRECTMHARLSLKYFDAMPLDTVSNADIENYRAVESARGIKTATVNRWLSELKYLAKWGVKHKLLESHNLDCIKRITELDSTPKTHHLSDDQRDALITQADIKSKQMIYGKSMAYILPLTHLLLRTGLRPGSAIGLVWADIDFDAAQIRLRAANIKTKKDAYIYMSGDTVEILKTWKKRTTGQPDDTIFPGDGRRLKSIKKQMKRLLTAAGLGQYSAYSLRHDCASELLRKGANLTDVQSALVHTDPRTTCKYAHPSAERMRQVAALLDTPKAPKSDEKAPEDG